MPLNPPPGYTRIAPYLLYEDTAAALEWLPKAFGFHERFRHPVGGRIDHAEMELAGGLIMLATPSTDAYPPATLRSRISARDATISSVNDRSTTPAATWPPTTNSAPRATGSARRTDSHHRNVTLIDKEPSHVFRTFHTMSAQLGSHSIPPGCSNGRTMSFHAASPWLEADRDPTQRDGIVRSFVLPVGAQATEPRPPSSDRAPVPRSIGWRHV
jgi:hypothetical protein